MTGGMRLARCPTCGHTGGIPRNLATDRRLRCSGCGETFLVRNAIGSRPVPLRRKTRARAERDHAAAEVLQRYSEGAAVLDAGGDNLDDLFEVRR